MSEKTKACNLTEYEIKSLLIVHGQAMSNNFEEAIDRIKYLNSRLKTFSEETKSENNAAGWTSTEEGN